RILSALEEAGGPMTALEVAEAVGASRATAQRHLAKLAEARTITVSLQSGSTGRPEHLYATRGAPAGNRWPPASDGRTGAGGFPMLRTAGGASRHRRTRSGLGTPPVFRRFLPAGPVRPPQPALETADDPVFVPHRT